MYNSSNARNICLRVFSVGNTLLRMEYDQGQPAGYLQRTTAPPTFTDNGLSLGIEPQQPHRLRLAESSPARVHSGTVPRNMTKSRYDPRQQRGDVNIPISHHEERQRRPPAKQYGRLISHGVAECKQCGLAKPIDEQYGLCRHCRPKQTPQMGYVGSCIRDGCTRMAVCNEGLCTPCLNPYNQHRARQSPNYYRQVQSQQLGLCIRKGCNNQAISNQGLCRNCVANEKRHQQSGSSNAKYGGF